MEFEFQAKMWIWGWWNRGVYHLVSIPSNFGQKIKKDDKIPKWWRRSVKIKIRIWFYTRKTSMFWSDKISSYFFIVKKSVIKDLDIKDDQKINFCIYTPKDTSL